MSHPLDLLALECLALVREAVGDGTDQAPEHPDARQIDAMLLDSMATGGAALLALARDAVRRMVARGPAGVSWQTLFSESELRQLADVIAAVLAAADGLGRQLVRDAASRVTESVTPTSQAPPPARAVGYLQGLLPTPGTDPQRGGPDLRRQAFTLAVSTSQQLTQAVQGELVRRLQSGEAAGGPHAVQQILDAAGVSPANPQYAEMVFRTNAMDSFNQASQEELTATVDVFPVWQYSNPHDSRSRPEHKARDGHYYPSSVPFTQVRGTDPADVCNCRCTFIPITRRKWQKLRDQGARIADGYADPLGQVQAPAPAPAAPRPPAWAETPPVRDLARAARVLGETPTAETLAPLAGGGPGDRVGLLTEPSALTVTVNGPGRQAAVTVRRDGDSLIARLNDILVADQQKGTGAAMLGRMTQALQRAGVAELRADAVRGEGDSGYYVWPRLGFDGPLPAGLGLPPGLAGARTVQELLARPGGVAWWRDHGVRVEVAFDLQPGSRSWDILRAYLARRL